MPRTLPPTSALVQGDTLQQPLESAALALGRLDGVWTNPPDNVYEVSNDMAALEQGVRHVFWRGLSNRLLREAHGVLLSSGRGPAKMPGDFSRSQDWVGGSRPGSAHFVPPPGTAVSDCMAALEFSLHSEDERLTVFLCPGIAHMQFETIHSFLESNGRVGRRLITLLLCDAEPLRQPFVCLSPYLTQHRSDYFALLNDVH